MNPLESPLAVSGTSRKETGTTWLTLFASTKRFSLSTAISDRAARVGNTSSPILQTSQQLESVPVPADE